MRCLSGTGFSREEASSAAISFLIVSTLRVGTINAIDQFSIGVWPDAFASKPAPTDLPLPRPAVDPDPALILIYSTPVQTPQNATWVQAERRFCAVGRAAWMRRERRQGMDVRSARAHGARPQ
jgi:hypothetical protein